MDDNYLKFSLLSVITRDLVTEGQVQGTGTTVRFPPLKKRKISLGKWFKRLSGEERLFLSMAVGGFTLANFQQLFSILWWSNKSVLKRYTHKRLIGTLVKLYRLGCFNLALLFIGYYWYRIFFANDGKKERDILADVNLNNEKNRGPIFSDTPEKIEQGGSILHAVLKVEGEDLRVSYELKGSCTVIISVPSRKIVSRVDCFDSKHFEKYSRLHAIDKDAVVTFYERDQDKCYFYIHGDQYTETSGVEFAKCGDKYEGITSSAL
ncbi:hypothetical protein B0I72DRAFT_167732 [Yarrowia lipolytica]|jgi:hypothetical protein|uniref:Uncharacterized protein n=1 Tax=Yarrowia lipolytica TaxID=4952 RepID=A0A1H6Q7G8_YARLL|nr:hypothetical protein YALI1_A22105g [Yarrowia lipolytica]KAB8280956.1 hypothetical protein BKA91DRAFT_169750 [Yarrowia lipolytica]KAE8174205.1 hypothetical protein BKA90DRAFT_166871 [Yarrowia lipolytica]KAJ8051903.1 hypothetical protein LXG23DRAFT_39611 [Yarrowia lipolytica]QNP95354.1 Hypothetical protein YALI2_A00353g [Yarrowia lipolytica]